MRVLLCHNKYFINGGDDVFFMEVGRVLEKNGHEVAYFSTHDDRNLPTPWQRYFPPAGNYLEGSLLKRILGFHRLVYSRRAKAGMKKIIGDFRPDIVHSFATHLRLTPSVLDACREEGVPVVMSCNDYKHICPNYKLFHGGRICEDCMGGRFYKAVANRCCKDSLVFSVASAIEGYTHHKLDIYRKNVAMFLFAGEFMAEKTQEFMGSGTFRWEILRNPFDSTARPYSSEAGNYLLYFGRLVEEKGVSVLIEAMNYVPRDVRLKIVGDGPMSAELSEAVSRRGLANVEFLGPKWNEDLYRILEKANFVVVPSIWHENFPYVILQSFSAGKAVIGTNRGGIPELVKDGEFGYIYEATDAKSLAEKIMLLWKDPARAVEMGRSAKTWSDGEFNDGHFYDRIMTIYRKVIL